MKSITVFTPTYNRAYTLPQLYQSLCKQSCKDFKWLVIDDGSTDNTESLIRGWKDDRILDIEYIKQENKGMLGAHNTAYDHIQTELNVCIDSDDYMPYDAVEIILDTWKKWRKPNHAGILGLDIFKSGEVIGVEFESNLIDVKFTTLKARYKSKLGDKKFVYRTDIINEYPRFPVIENEKFPAAGLLYRKIDKDYDLLAINKPLCVVEYLPDGNSKNKISQYWKNPNAFAIYRIERMKLSNSYLEIFRNAIHYVSSCLIGRRKSIFKKSPYPIITFLCVPFGIILYFYIMRTKRKGVMK